MNPTGNKIIEGIFGVRRSGQSGVQLACLDSRLATTLLEEDPAMITVVAR
jgi:hypothetical protein